MITFKEKYELFINGEFIEPKSGKYIATYNPANGEKLSEIADASKEDVDLAVSGAKKAFESWKHTSVKERATILRKIADVIEENADYLAMVETLDNGKPIRETKNIDIPLSYEHFRYFASLIETESGESTVLEDRYLSLVTKEPIGVVGQIVPWNFPFAMAAWKLAPVLASGDVTVFKPSSTTSLSVLEFARLTKDIIPAGVFQVITGSGRKAGQYILDHEDITKLAFTGSTEVGYSVAEAAAKKLIPATLELGGKSANIIFADADFEKVMDGIQLGILFNQGQVCCAGSRIFVEESIYDKFVEEAVKRFEQVKVGLPWLEDTQMGSQISKGQRDKIMSYVELAKEEGAHIATGGEPYTDEDCKNGAFMKPTLIIDARNDMRVAQEEIFGPVAVVIPFKSEEEVIKMANDSEYGLGGAVFTKDINRAFRVANGIETGRVWVNTYNQLPAGAPFGGIKKSGIGRETHKMILDSYRYTKNIMIDLKEDPSGFYPYKG